MRKSIISFHYLQTLLCWHLCCSPFLGDLFNLLNLNTTFSQVLVWVYSVLLFCFLIYLLLNSYICLGKTRTKEKYRVVYTDHQRLELEKEFHFNRYITIRRKSELAVNLGLSERQVRSGIQSQVIISLQTIKAL